MLQVKHISKRYGQQQVLSDISFDLGEGELIALVGPNGVGKSTLLSIIVNLEQADEGAVTIKGRSNKERAIFKDVSFMLEATSLYPALTGYDHLLYVANLHQVPKEETDRLIERLGLASYIRRRVSSYSLGMKQKLLFAMAIVVKPKLLLLDEPHIGLDPTNIIQQRQIILELQAQGVAILLSSHHLAEIERLTNQIYFLKEGRLIKKELSLLEGAAYHLTTVNSQQILEVAKAKELVVRDHGLPEQLEFVVPEKQFLDVLRAIPSSQLIRIEKSRDYMERIYQEIYQLEIEEQARDLL